MKAKTYKIREEIVPILKRMIENKKVPVKRIKLIKLSDDHFNGNHPNGINEGFTTAGLLVYLPKVGERFYLAGTNFSTSIVIEELNKDNIFKTTYSTYKIEYLN